MTKLHLQFQRIWLNTNYLCAYYITFLSFEPFSLLSNSSISLDDIKKNLFKIKHFQLMSNVNFNTPCLWHWKPLQPISLSLLVSTAPATSIERDAKIIPVVSLLHIFISFLWELNKLYNFCTMGKPITTHMLLNTVKLVAGIYKKNIHKIKQRHYI